MKHQLFCIKDIKRTTNCNKYETDKAYLKLDVKNWRLAFVTSVISQRYLRCILQQPDDYVTPSTTTL